MIYFTVSLLDCFMRCMQPTQQHGRRTPSNSSIITLSTCFFLVSSVLTFIVQQIHSLRASGVMSSHLSSADSSDNSALSKSGGIWCTTPAEISFVIIHIFYICYTSDSTAPLALCYHNTLQLAYE